MIWVVDASTVVAYLLGQASNVERDGILGDAHAPTLIDLEATQTLRGLVRSSKLPVASAEQARIELMELGVRRHPDSAVLRRAWELRDACTIYDGVYVALAEALDAVLLTRDARLAKGVSGLVTVVTSG